MDMRTDASNLPAEKRDLPSVRLAMPEDEDEIMEMCRRLHGENGLFSLSEEKVRGCLERYYRRDGVIVGVIGSVGKIEASTCLLFSEMYYTTEWHLAELWNYVQPEFRQSRNAEALIDFGKRSAVKIGVPLITGIITNNRTAEKVRLYRRLLGYPGGAFFVYNATWSNDHHQSDDIWKVLLKDTSSLREVPKGARVVWPEVLERLGGGNVEEGRRILDGFLKRHTKSGGKLS